MSTEAQHEADARREARRQIEFARREAREGTVQAAWEHVREAARLARGIQDAELLARAATAVTDPDASQWRLTPARQALCVEALAMLPAGAAHDELRERTQSLLDSLSAGWSEKRVTSRERVPSEVAERRFAALQAAHARLNGPEGPAEALALGSESVELGRAAGDDTLVAWGRLWRLGASLRLGRRILVDDEARELSALVHTMTSPLWSWRLAAVEANLALLDDRLDAVPALARRALELGRRAGAEEADWMHLTVRAELALRTGIGLDDIESQVRSAIVGAPFFAQGWRAIVLLALDRDDEALAIWRALAPHVQELPPDAREWLVATAGHARLAVRARDTAAARVLYDMLLPFGQLHIASPATAPYEGPVALALAAVAGLLGDHEGERRWNAEALQRSEAMAAPWFIAQSLRQAEGARLRFAPLSTRESEVARLVARGATNREVAATLHLSERTVEQYVSTALHRLGVANRAALAVWALQRSGELYPPYHGSTP